MKKIPTFNENRHALPVTVTVCTYVCIRGRSWPTLCPRGHRCRRAGTRCSRGRRCCVRICKLCDCSRPIPSRWCTRRRGRCICNGPPRRYRPRHRSRTLAPVGCRRLRRRRCWAGRRRREVPSLIPIPEKRGNMFNHSSHRHYTTHYLKTTREWIGTINVIENPR